MGNEASECISMEIFLMGVSLSSMLLFPGEDREHLLISTLLPAAGRKICVHLAARVCHHDACHAIQLGNPEAGTCF